MQDNRIKLTLISALKGTIDARTLLLPLFLATLGYGSGSISYIFSLETITMSFPALLTGFLSDKYGRRIVLSISLLMFAVANLFYALTSFSLIVVAAVLVGVATSFYYPSFDSLVPESSANSTETAQTYGTIFAVNSMVGIAYYSLSVLPQFNPAYFNYLFLFFSGLLVLGTVLTYSLKEKSRPMTTVRSLYKVSMQDVFVYVTFFLGGAGLGLATTLLPYWLHLRGYDILQIGFVYIGVTIITALTSIVGGRLVKAIGLGASTFSLGMLRVISVVLIALVSYAYIPVLAYFVFAGLSAPVVNTVVSSLTRPATRGAMIGYITISRNLGLTVGILLFGALVTMGLSTPILAGAMVLTTYVVGSTKLVLAKGEEGWQGSKIE